MSRCPDAEAVAALIREVAAVEIVPRFRHLDAAEVREKEPGQIVTIADVEAERALSHGLTALLPAALVGEEAVAQTPALLAALEGEGAVWVIDPVDGTANFAAGNPRFAVIVALVVDGCTVMGWIYDPMGGRMVVAEAGQGAWLDGSRLSVLSEVPLAEMRGSVKRAGGSQPPRFARVGRRGSAAHDYLDLVTGELHFAHFRKLMPWDHAAGVLIHAEAGGHGALVDGTPYRPVSQPAAALLLAPGRQSWDALRNEVR